MKTLILLLTSLFVWNAFAERVGTDERVYRCAADANAQNVGANEIFEVHVVRGREMTLNHPSDGKWFKAVTNGRGYYVYGSEGNFWSSSAVGGYIGDVDEDGRLRVAHQVSPGSYANNVLQCTQTKVISEYAPLTATERMLQDIGDNANVANGGYELRPYDPKSLDLNKEWRKIKKDGRDWKGCTWTRLTDHDAILKMVREDAYDPETAVKIEALKSAPGVAQMIGYQSDDDVSCSQRWVWLYTSDGFKFELQYSQGD